MRKYDNIESEEYKVDLIVDFYPRKYDPDVEVFLFMNYTPYYPFDWKSFFNEGKSIREILQRFEDTFLEIPPIELYINNSGVLRATPLSDRKFDI